MRFALQIARRYLFAKKSTNAINLIAIISALGMMFITAALVLILSVFNGFEDLVISLYNNFNPDLKIVVNKGKVFVPEEHLLNEIKALPEVDNVSLVLEEIAMLSHNDKRSLTHAKGVDENFTKVSRVDTAMVDGHFILKEGANNYTVLGYGIQIELGLNVRSDFSVINVHLPNRKAKPGSINPDEAFRTKQVRPAGSFSIQEEFDRKYVFFSLDFMRELLQYDDEISSLEIDFADGVDQAEAQEKITAIMGSDFKVLNRLQQDAFLYKVMNLEKWITFLILSLMMLVASFNIIGSLSMLVIEKSRDIGILKAMGATKSMIRKIFMIEGSLISILGGFIGMIIALAICLLQQKFKLVKIDGDFFLLDAYPVALRWIDFVMVFLVVVFISLLASWYPSKKAAERSSLTGKDLAV